jgi:ATP-dependent RNA helicase RhlE
LSFSALRLHPSLLLALRELGFQNPTPIQRQAIPPAIDGRDLVASAMTGSGKTAAFALPILQRLAAQPAGTTRALVLTPTRELAGQIEEHVRDLARHTRIKAAAVFGGVGMRSQEQAFRGGVDVIVATPGRLLDHMRAPYCALRGVEVLVIDEADRMLDMGFLPDVRRVLAKLPARRQTLLFSASMPAPIQALARQMLRSPATIAIGRPTTPAASISQALYPVSAELKSALLAELVRSGEIRNVIAFTRTKHRANRLAEYLVRNGVAARRIHGNRSQAQRTQALGGFKAGRFPVLVATDIAARGVDVDDLSHVVDFDVPASPEDYVHRVGRTARAEAKGDACTAASKVTTRPGAESGSRPSSTSRCTTIGERWRRAVPVSALRRAPSATRDPVRTRHVVELRRGAGHGRREARRGGGLRPRLRWTSLRPAAGSGHADDSAPASLTM